MINMSEFVGKKIALLGSTGYIGRSLLNEFVTNHKEVIVVPFVRRVDKAQNLWKECGVEFSMPETYDTFLDTEFDIVINATGVGSPKKIKENPKQVFEATESMDDLIFEYLEKHQNTRIFNLSSGSVYGKSAGACVTKDTEAVFSLRDLSGGDFYSLAKLYSEVKHRAFLEHSIIDLRVFSFFSRFVDIEDSFFLSEVSKCLLEKKRFYTPPTDMVRDYVTANDVVEVIIFLTGLEPKNTTFDLVTKKPASKFEILESLQREFDLYYEIEKGLNKNSPTGNKSDYYSASTILHDLGFSPKKTSMENIKIEMTALINRSNNA